MRLGPEAWGKSRWYYDSLSIVNEGDITEQTGAGRYGLVRDIPSYERFWRYHVAPATERPFSIRARDEADQIVKLIAQRSYSVFSDIVEALTQMEIIQQEGLGERSRNATITLKFAGDALVMFDELERLIAGPTNPFTNSLGFLAQRFPNGFIPLSKNEKEAWKFLRENIVVYRHYLTHSGTLYRVHSDLSGETFVLQRKHLEGRIPKAWSDAEKKHTSRQDWQELGDACRQVVRDTIALLDLGYQMRVEQMGNLVAHAEYQTLWGWKEGMSEIPNPAPRLQGRGFGSGTGITDVLVGSAVSTDIYAVKQQLSSTEANSSIITGNWGGPF